MKTLTILLVLLFTLPAFARTSGRRSSSTPRSSGTVRVRPYTTKRGAYVAPHARTRGNRTQTDNWSSKGNVNPTTGKKGTKTPKR